MPFSVFQLQTIEWTAVCSKGTAQNCPGSTPQYYLPCMVPCSLHEELLRAECHVACCAKLRLMRWHPSCPVLLQKGDLKWSKCMLNKQIELLTMALGETPLTVYCMPIESGVSHQTNQRRQSSYGVIIFTIYHTDTFALENMLLF